MMLTKKNLMVVIGVIVAIALAAYLLSRLPLLSEGFEDEEKKDMEDEDMNEEGEDMDEEEEDDAPKPVEKDQFCFGSYCNDIDGEEVTPADTMKKALE